MSEGFEAFRQADYAYALTLLRDVIAGDPNNVVAYNLAGICSLELRDYNTPIDSFKHALPTPARRVAQPGRPQPGVRVGRDDQGVRAYPSARARRRLPANFQFVFDAFDTGERKVQVAQFPLPHRAA